MKAATPHKTLLTCKPVKTSRGFTVAIVWATLAVDVLFFGALVPLLPKYVEQLGLGKVANKSEQILNYGNATQNLTVVVCPTTGTATGTGSVIVGVLVALQQWAQVVSNLFVGPLVDKIGYDVPMLIGYFVVVGASLGFAFADTLVALVICRALHGVGSSLLKTSGLAVVADLYHDNDDQRGKMIGIVMCGLSVGLVAGPPFGSVLYQLGGKKAPFFAIAFLAFIIGVLQTCTRKPKIGSLQASDNKSNCQAQIKLIKDPYVLITVVLMTLGGVGLGFLEGSLPLHMMMTMCPEDWMLGTVFLSLNLAFALSIPVLGYLNQFVGKWFVTFVSFIVAAVAAIGYAFCGSFVELLAPGIPMGVAAAVTPATIVPVLTYIVDTRIGRSVYGSAFGLANAATSLAFGTTPLLAGILVPLIGFDGLMYISAGLSIIALVPAGFLRKALTSPSTVSEEKTELLPKQKVKKALLSPE